MSRVDRITKNEERLDEISSSVKKLEIALRHLNITLLDHFIFGKNGESISMREYGALKY